jgi:hypothetical protein
MIGRSKDERTSPQHVGQRAGIILRIGRDFGEGNIAGRLDEFSEFSLRRAAVSFAARAFPPMRANSEIVRFFFTPQSQS